MFILCYVVLLQLSETLSILIPALIFLLLYKVCHISSARMIAFLKKYTVGKVFFILLLCEGIAFFPLLPFMIQTFSTYTSSPELFAYSIFILQLLPWTLKLKKAIELVQGNAKKQQDHAIYQ